MNSPSGQRHHFLDFLSSCFGAAESFFSLFLVVGMQPHPQEFCFLSVICITSFQSMLGYLHPHSLMRSSTPASSFFNWSR